MIRFINSLLGLGSRSAQFSLVHANIMYYLLIRVVLISALMIFFGFIMNLVNFKDINIALSLIFIIGIALALARPRNLAAIAGAGAIIEKMRENDSLATGAEDFLKGYAKLVGNILIILSAVFLALGTIPLRENPGAFWVALVAIILIRLIYGVWNIGGNFGKKAIYYYAFSMIIICMHSLVPSHVWIKTTGHDLSLTSLFESSESERALAKYEKTDKELTDEKMASKLNAITKKIKNGKKLSEDDIKTLEAARSKRTKQSIPQRASAALGKIKTVSFSSSADTSNYYQPGWAHIPIPVTSASLHRVTGPNNERAGTGEIFITKLYPGRYRVSMNGSYKKRFSSGKWYRKPIPWSGFNHKKSTNEPYKNILYGAVILRIGNQDGLTPGIYNITKEENLYAELNIVRDYDAYIDNQGKMKLGYSNLSMKIERI